MDIRNDYQLRQVLNEVLREIINSISEIVLDKLQMNLMKYTYIELPNKVYEKGSGAFGQRMPSFEFFDAFQLKKIKVAVGEITSELFYNWQTMTVSKDTGRHFSDGKDTRKNLADLLNVDDFVAMKQRGAFWDRTVEELDKEMESIFRNELRKRGLT